MTAQISPRSFTSPAAGTWLDRVIRTNNHDVAPTVARVVLGAVMFPHGAQKVLGWFGGPGLGGTIQGMTSFMHIPLPFALLAIAAEFLGAIGLITGTLTRIAAFGIGVTMTVAVLMAHVHNGFFMNWHGTQAGEGFEYHLLAIALAVVVMIKGAGAYSVDARIAR